MKYLTYLTELGPILKDALAKSEPRLIVIAALWIATLIVILTVLTGCGAVQYEPIETSTITVENKLPKGNTNAKTDQTKQTGQ